MTFACVVLAWNPALTPPADDCGDCHDTAVTGVHERLVCVDCHAPGGLPVAAPGRAAGAGAGCVHCHAGTGGVLDGPMARPDCGRSTVGAALDRRAPGAHARRCQTCHVDTCLDCHGGDGHALRRPTFDDCHGCHRGVFVGPDYLGRAPRQDALRYRRGPETDGERYLPMAPDVHAVAGMACGACHSMASLARGERASRTCRDCHTPSPGVPEHDVAAHLDGMTCPSCHAGWAAQEYGTFLLDVDDAEIARLYRLRPDGDTPGAFRSAYLRQQGLPPLGLDAQGRVSPIRPQFILYATTVRDGRVVGRENELLAADWRALSPHTIQRGGALCGACHGAPRRFVAEPPEDRIYDLARDGMGLSSFWRPEGQRVTNGAFYPPERYASRVAPRGADYMAVAVRRWRTLLDRVAPGPPVAPSTAPPAAPPAD